MKRLFTLLIFLPSISFGQKNTDLLVQTSYSHVGLNFGITFTRQYSDKFSFSSGLNYLINRPVYDNLDFAFRHRFYAVKAYQAIGIHAGIRRKINLPESALEPYFFYRFQATHAPTRTLSQYVDTTVVYQPNPQTIHVIESSYYIYKKSIWAFENILGIGFDVKLHSKWYLSASAGVGPSLIIAPSEQGSNGGYFRTIEIGDYYSLGITYRLKPKI